jgi:tripartite motif-containing protein 71
MRTSRVALALLGSALGGCGVAERDLSDPHMPGQGGSMVGTVANGGGSGSAGAPVAAGGGGAASIGGNPAGSLAGSGPGGSAQGVGGQGVGGSPQPMPTVLPPVSGLVTPEWAIGAEGVGPNFFTDARSVGVDGAGNIYVGDYEEGARVQVFDASGAFVRQWSMSGDDYLVSLAVDQNGIVYAVQGTDIVRYDGATGTLLGQLSYSGGPPGTPDLSLFYPDVVGVTAENEVVAVSGEAIVRFNTQGAVEMAEVEALAAVVDGIPSPSSVAVDGAGNIYIVDSFQYEVYKFSPQGVFLDRFSSEGEGPGKLATGPDGVAVDGRGRIYVSEFFEGIEVFDAAGLSLGVIPVEGYVFGLAVTLQNELVLIDRNAFKLLKYSINP